MKNRMIPTVFPLVFFVARALDSHSAIDLRQVLVAGAGASLLRREPSETESSEVSDRRTVTSEIRIGNISSELVSPTLEHALRASSKRVSSSSDRARTSFSERDELGKLRQDARANYREERQLMSRLESELRRTSQTKRPDGDGGSSRMLIHSCKNETKSNPCEFTGCGGSDGHTGMCRTNGNCYSRATADASSCNGVADGVDVPGSPELFCLEGYPTRICPPKSCKDVLKVLGTVECSVLNSEDPGFCSNESLTTLIRIFCRHTCGLCTRASTNDAADEASTSSGESAGDGIAAATRTVVDALASCRAEGDCCPRGFTCKLPKDAQMEACVDDKDEEKTVNSVKCSDLKNATEDIFISCQADTECCPVGFTCKLPKDAQIEACVNDTDDEKTVNSVKCSDQSNTKINPLVSCQAETECCPAGYTCKLPKDAQLEACVDDSDDSKTVNSTKCSDQDPWIYFLGVSAAVVILIAVVSIRMYLIKVGEQQLKEEEIRGTAEAAKEGAVAAAAAEEGVVEGEEGQVSAGDGLAAAEAKEGGVEGEAGLDAAAASPDPTLPSPPDAAAAVVAASAAPGVPAPPS